MCRYIRQDKNWPDQLYWFQHVQTPDMYMYLAICLMKKVANFWKKAA